MKLLFDDQTFTAQRFGGISRYFVELVKNFPKDIECEISTQFSDNAYIGEIMPGIGRLPQIPLRKDIGKLVNRTVSRRAVKRSDFDLFHPTYYNPYFLKSLDKPFVLTVHDMIHERFAGSFRHDDPTAGYKRKLIDKAAAIIAISESTKRDLQEFYGVDENRITVIYHGKNKLADTESTIAGLPERYILFVGDRNRYKNFDGLVSAFASLLGSCPGLHLVCTGRPFSKYELELLSNKGIPDLCHQYFVTDSQLRYLYTHAECFVFPSLFEGFGFPVLESFDAGCPLVVSNTSSLPEIARDGGIYFNPYDSDDIASKILQVIENPELKARMINKGHRIASEFSWERTAGLTASLYRKVIS